MGILMPALARVRQIAYRMVCGTNLSGIGKAMLIYSNDYDESYPIAGGSGSAWSTNGYISDWDAVDEDTAFSDGTATVSSSLYLLVKFADVTPKQFTCKGDGATAFKLSDTTTTVADITEVWDFGDEPGKHCSYAYHLPYGSHTITVSSNAGCPVAADRNPYLDENADAYIDGAAAGEDAPSWSINGVYYDPDKSGNAAAHQREGQNILFNDIHVKFEKWPNYGIDSDNIWKSWAAAAPPEPGVEGKQLGTVPYSSVLTGEGIGEPEAEKDAYLVNERQDSY
jgi:hypothetical protein